MILFNFAVNGSFVVPKISSVGIYFYGFVVTKKGRKDIFEMGVNCLRNWSDDLAPAKIRAADLAAGKAAVELRLH